MILPDKHIEISASLIGQGGKVLSALQTPKTISALWSSFKNNQDCPPFQKFTLTLAFLYALGAISYQDGELKRVK